MSMRWVKGRTRIKWLPSTTSQAMSANSLASISSGKIIPATSSTTKHPGINLKAVTSASAEYATSLPLPIEVPLERDCELEATTTATLAATQVGDDGDLTDASTVNMGASTHKVVTCTAFISSTLGRYKLNNQSILA